MPHSASKSGGGRYALTARQDAANKGGYRKHNPRRKKMRRRPLTATGY